MVCALHLDSLPLYERYFPRGWTSVVARLLGLGPRLSYGSDATAAAPFGKAARSLVDTASAAITACANTNWPPTLKQFAHLCYMQVYLEGTAIALFATHLRAVADANPAKAASSLRMMQSMRREADQLNRAFHGFASGRVNQQEYATYLYHRSVTNGWHQPTTG